MSENLLIERLVLLIPLLMSLGVHEWAHAWSAYKLGDDTAKQLGRLSLNPLVHIHPIGTFVLPLLGIPFGWARPVPFNPLRFRGSVSLRTGSLIVALSGPASNIIFAILCVTIMILIWLFSLNNLSLVPGVRELLHSLLVINLTLAIFNLVPVVPLDGSYVVDALMTDNLRPLWNKFTALGYLPPIIALIVIAPLIQLITKQLLRIEFFFLF